LVASHVTTTVAVIPFSPAVTWQDVFSSAACLFSSHDRSTPMSHITGFLTPVPNANKARYIKSAEVAWPLFQKYGALKQVDHPLNRPLGLFAAR